MKKMLLILSLVFLIAGSMLAGTLAYYTTAVDLTAGSVVAKEFIFLGEGTDSFTDNEKIAPTETVSWPFRVKNHADGTVTETDLYYKLTFDISATAGKEAIAPLLITVRGPGGGILGSITGTGSFELYEEFPLSEEGQHHDYVVEIYWPDGGEGDIDYAGSNFGSTIKVSAVASQVPFEQPEPESRIHVLYEIVDSWNQGGVNKFQYRVTITNQTEQQIDNWSISFTLPVEELTDSLWGAVAEHEGLPEGSYRFRHPDQYNQNIPPGSSITFGGHGLGRGWRALQNVRVKGSPVELECALAPGAEEPDDPPQGSIDVFYETTAPDYGSKFKYGITINNNTDRDIFNWFITFSLPLDRLTGAVWNARAAHDDLPEGSYKFLHPANYNQDIPAGGSVYFSGHGFGTGAEAIENVLVKDNNAELTYSFGTLK